MTAPLPTSSSTPHPRRYPRAASLPLPSETAGTGRLVHSTSPCPVVSLPSASASASASALALMRTSVKTFPRRLPARCTLAALLFTACRCPPPTVCAAASSRPTWLAYRFSAHSTLHEAIRVKSTGTHGQHSTHPSPRPHALPLTGSHQTPRPVRCIHRIHCAFPVVPAFPASPSAPARAAISRSLHSSFHPPKLSCPP